MNQVPEYSQIQEFQNLVEKAKKRYLKYLISLGYVFEQQGSYEDTRYLAIHPSYYLTSHELLEKECQENRYISDGKYSPEDYPLGAFISINSLCVEDGRFSVLSSEFLEDDRCSLDYLDEC